MDWRIWVSVRDSSTPPRTPLRLRPDSGRPGYLRHGSPELPFCLAKSVYGPPHPYYNLLTFSHCSRTCSSLHLPKKASVHHSQSNRPAGKSSRVPPRYSRPLYSAIFSRYFTYQSAVTSPFSFTSIIKNLWKQKITTLLLLASPPLLSDSFWGIS